MRVWEIVELLKAFSFIEDFFDVFKLLPFYHILFFPEKMRGISLHLQRTSKQRVYLDKLEAGLDWCLKLLSL